MENYNLKRDLILEWVLLSIQVICIIAPILFFQQLFIVPIQEMVNGNFVLMGVGVIMVMLSFLLVGLYILSFLAGIITSLTLAIIQTRCYLCKKIQKGLIAFSTIKIKVVLGVAILFVSDCFNLCLFEVGWYWGALGGCVMLGVTSLYVFTTVYSFKRRSYYKSKEVN